MVKLLMSCLVTTNFRLTVDPSILPDGVSEAVHINIDPNAEKPQEIQRGLMEDKPTSLLFYTRHKT